jgi:hypothetical protein
LAKEDGKSVREIVTALGWVTAAEFDELITPEAVCRLGSADGNPKPEMWQNPKPEIRSPKEARNPKSE